MFLFKLFFLIVLKCLVLISFLLVLLLVVIVFFAILYFPIFHLAKHEQNTPLNPRTQKRRNNDNENKDECR